MQAVSSGAPLANAGNAQTVDPGANVTLDGSSSSDNGVIVSYQWQQVGGIPVVLNNADQATAGFTAPLPAGLLQFSLTVTDDEGLSSTDVVNVTVSDVPPVLDTGGNRTVKAGEALNFTVTASDANGTPPVLSASGVPKGATFDPVTGAFAWPSARPAGTYSVTFTATDGVNTVDEPVVITVEESGGSGGGVLDILVLLWTAGLLVKGFRIARS
ncbi:MAG: PKD domain-containing protein [Gammaproteobacteria bacterium]